MPEMPEPAEYRDNQAWDTWPECVMTLAEVPLDARRVSFRRERHSQRGLAARGAIEQLVAKQVNQAFVQEIAQLSALSYLEIHDLTATDLTPLGQLKQLRTLKLIDVRAPCAWEPLLELASLRRLFIENAKHLHRLDAFQQAHQLIALGIEGGMWRQQRLASLAPLAGLRRLEALFLTAVKLDDPALHYLAEIPRLRLLDCARFAPQENFADLRRLRPELVCRWCERYEV
ncbi:hypothetical protein SAMN05216214_101220 [Atopomonas hussainii]|uniref:Leucine Rich Repeat protein n=2 Tax=Atopomonas hussainii TaxID=1429083 RepID=A0A1H7FIT4_9GAMM|nr:hypothetical protein SAMN05216214_101220 [Atopomonas hussainii]